MKDITGGFQLCESALQDQQDTDPEQEEDGGKEGGGLGRRRSSRAVKKVKTFADEFITGETAAKSREGTPVGSSPRGKSLYLS